MENIFRWFMFDDDITVVHINWFTGVFQEEDFTGIEKLFFCFLEYCAFLDVTAQRKYFESFLITEGKVKIRELNIKLDTMTSLDYKDPIALEEAYRIIGKTALDVYEKWKLLDLTNRTFKVDMHEFIRTMKKSSIQQTMVKYFPKLQEGIDIDTVTEDLLIEVTRAKIAYDVEKIEEIDFMSGRQRESKKKKTLTKLFDTGVPCIDEDSKGIFTQEIITLNGQPGGGKTRFLTKHFIYPALVAGYSVIYDSVEMKEIQIQNILIAIHIIHLYAGNVKIPDMTATKGLLTSEQSQYWESARIDLFESGKYGKLFYRRRVPVEQIEQKTKNLLKRNSDIKLWAYDYMGRMPSVPEGKYSPHLQQYEIVTKGYEIIREVVDTCDIAAVCLNQYNDKGIANAYAGRAITSGCIEGGHIVERESDYDLSMTFTEEQEAANLMGLSTTKKRGTAGFKDVTFSVDKSISNFTQLKATNTRK